MEIGVPVSGEYKKIFSTYADEEDYSLSAVEEECDGRPYRLVFKLRPYESIIFSVPFHESTEEEKEKERESRRRIKQAHEDAISDNKYVPKVASPEAPQESKPAAKKKGVTIARLRARKTVKKQEDKTE